MSDSIRRRRPTTPGEILHEEFLIPLGMTQKQKAVDLWEAARHVPVLPRPLLKAS